MRLPVVTRSFIRFLRDISPGQSRHHYRDEKMNPKTHPQYQHYQVNPPTTRGNGAASAYYRGWECGHEIAHHLCPYTETSHSWAAWHAGKDAREKSNDD